jgi:hypothetical protein
MSTTRMTRDEIRAAEEADWARYREMIPRLRKVVSREPGFAVNCLGDRCEAVVAYYGAPVRTVIVLMTAGASLEGTRRLKDIDYAAVEEALHLEV